MYDKETLKEIIENIENNEMYNDLNISERLFIITRLLNNTTNLISPYMIDTEEDGKCVRKIYKALNILLEIEEEENKK